ncbi:MAG TPA: hypothetical protein VIB55_07450, partial [Longimicrobium sp.]
RSQAICDQCKQGVETRFEYRTYSLESPKIDVEHVLVAVCTTCGGVAAVPFQSSLKLKEARESGAKSD